jgi:hypothetical protein
MPSIHDPLFTLPLPSRAPFAWGASPFHARGSVYREEIVLADRLLEKAGQPRSLDVLKKQGDAKLDAFMGQKFASTEWYDVMPVLYFTSAVARARGVSFTQHVRDSAVAHASNALTGFTSVILKMLSNESVATWMPRISGWYHDFGKVETKVIGPCHVRGVRTGLPAVFVQAWSITAMHFAEHVLAHAGAREPRAHTLEAIEDGEREGVKLYRVTFDVKWEA